MPLHNHLKEYRAKLNVNQQEMGALVGTSRQTISQIERGDYSPSVTLALKIAKVSVPSSSYSNISSTEAPHTLAILSANVTEGE